VTELDDQQSANDTPATTRRTVLRTAGLLALASASTAALASCSAEAETGSPAATPAAATSPPASPSPIADATSPKPSASNAEAPDGPSVATSEVPVGGGVILDDADYVVTQPSRGKYQAFSKICTHQGCPVSAVENGVIHCNCHGSEYSISDGSVTNPPATKPLAESKTTVFEGAVYVTG
jgi:Rieske Fe-S protein